MSRIVSSLAAPGCFRLFLALLVFVDHSTRLNLGTAAVFIFFILSGYWIKVMWAKRYSHGPYLTYIVSRFWRLMPVFALGSCLSWMLLIARGAVPPVHDALLHQFISNIFIIGYDLLAFRANGPAWSLDIEVQFYLVAPLLIAALNWSRWTLIPCLIVSVTMMLYDREQTLLPYVGFFALGISFAAMNWTPKRQVARLSLLGSGALVLGCLASPYRDLILGGVHPRPLHAYCNLASMGIALLMAPWAMFTTGQTGSVRDGMYGDLSFILYILHWPVLQVFNTSVGSPLDRGIATLEVFVVTLFAALLIWWSFDRPIDRLRSAWVARRQGRANGVPASEHDALETLGTTSIALCPVSRAWAGLRTFAARPRRRCRAPTRR